MRTLHSVSARVLWESALALKLKLLMREIIIDGEVRISVLEIRGDRVKIGVTAPNSVSIQRMEVTLRKHGLKKVPARVPLGSM